mmetsp:Transcript_41777/g.98048  ORF Transcript_41777/g.98048 Transcript_41777/m.98048 type:complete len:133 (+) Transcript_41777:380-778(+)
MGAFSTRSGKNRHRKEKAVTSSVYLQLGAGNFKNVRPPAVVAARTLNTLARAMWGRVGWIEKLAAAGIHRWRARAAKRLSEVQYADAVIQLEVQCRELGFGAVSSGWRAASSPPRSTRRRSGPRSSTSSSFS